MNYSENQINDKLKNLKDWNFNAEALEKKYEFKNFTEAMAFLLRIAFLAEKQNHHPEIWNVYNKVKLRLSTHDANGITDKDFKLAELINELS